MTSDALRPASITGALLLAALVAGTIVVNQMSGHWRENIDDSHLFAYYGWCVADGARPYLDLWDNKPPGIWWINAAAVRLLGERGAEIDLAVGAAALLLSVVSLLCAAATAWGRSALWFAAPAVCVLLTHNVFECGTNRTETWLTACECAGVAAYLRAVATGRSRWLVIAGVLLGAAPWFKQNGIAALVACCVDTAAMRGDGRLRRLITLLTGAAIPSVIAGTVLALQGALGAAAYAMFGFNRLYFERGTAHWINPFALEAVYIPHARFVAAALACAAAGPVVAFVRRLARRSGIAPADDAGRGRIEIAPLAWTWFIALAYLTSIGISPFPYPMAPLLAPLALLACDPLARWLGDRNVARALARRAGCCAAYVLLLAGVVGVWIDSYAEARRCLRQKPHFAALARRTPAQCELQAAELRRVTRPGDRIYVWGWSPGTYRYAYRRSAARFATIEKVGQIGAAARFIVDEARNDIRRNPPAAFVASIGDLRGIRVDASDDFGAWLDAHYVDHAEIEGMVILLRRSEKQ